MLLRIRNAGLALAAAALLAAPLAQAQSSYPDKPLRFLIGYAPGGPTDIWTRMIGRRLSEIFKQPVIVDNKPGAGGIIAIAELAKSQPDGYTLSFGGLVFAGPIFHNDLSYDIRRDFTLVGGLYKTGFVLAVPSSVPAKTLPEFIALVKANPGKYNYAAGTNSGELIMEMLKAQTGMDATAVRYKGNAAALTALVAGDVQAGFDQLGPFKPMAQAGKLRLLAVTGERMSSIPSVPTLAESGFPKVTVITRSTIFARSGLPADTVAKLNAAIREGAKNPEFAERLKLEDADAYSPTIPELKNVVDEDIAFWSEAARVANYKP